MDKQKQPGQAGRHLLPIDGSSIAPSLSPEVVTRGEMDAMIGMANHVLKVDGIESTINGMPALVSNCKVEVQVPGHDVVTGNDTQQTVYYARVFKMLGDDIKNPLSPLPGVVFDETPDVHVLTPNPYAVRFLELFNGAGLVVDTSDLDPTVNDPAHVNLVKDVLKTMSSEVEAKAAEQRRIEQEHKTRIEQERKNRRDYRIQRAKQIGGVVLGGLAGLAAAGGLITAAIYGIGKLDFPESPSFDDMKYTLEGGTELSLGTGSESHPQFSKQLYEDPSLQANDVPYLRATEESTSSTNSGDSQLDLSDTLRQITIYSSKPDKNCSTAAVGKVPLDTRLVAWTDFTAPNGTSRADELTVLYETDKVKVCWNGQENGPNDDPRVVVSLRPAAAARPR